VRMARIQHRPTWVRRMGSLCALAALIAFPVALYRLAGAPSVPHLTTLRAARRLLSASDEGALGANVLRNIERVVWVLWAYLAFATAGTAITRVLDLLGFHWLRRAWERVQPRSVIATANFLLVVGLSVSPRMALAATPVTASIVASASPQPGPAALPPASIVQHQAPPVPAASREHVVAPGENLWEIASSECGSPLVWRDIADANGLEHPSLIHAGMTLSLPASCSVPASVGYMVQPRDNLTTIAQHEYGRASAWTAIWEANRDRVMNDGRVFTQPETIHSGWVLNLPSVTGAAPGANPAVSPPPLPASPTPAAAEPVPGSVVPGSLSPTAIPTPASPLDASPSPAPSPATQAVAGGTVPSAVPTRPDTRPSAPPTVTRGRSWRVHLPGGSFIPWSLAASLLGVAAVAKLRRQRDRPLNAGLPTGGQRPEGPFLTAMRRGGVEPCFDTLGPLAEHVLETWTGAAAFPRILAAWEAGPETAFLLDVGADVQLPASSRSGNVGVRFEHDQGRTWAIASAEQGPGLRRGIHALADGLLVPVGGRDEGALHIPLLGLPVAVDGPQAAAMAAAMVFQAAARCLPEDLNIFVVGDVGHFFDEGLPAGDGDLPELQRVGAEGEEALRSRIETQLAANAALMGDYGLTDLSEHALAHPDDRPIAALVVLEPALAKLWAPLLHFGRHLGLAAVVMGKCPGPSRLLQIDPFGTLHIEGDDLGDVGDLAPCLLTEELTQEMGELVAPDQAEVAQEKADPAAGGDDAWRGDQVAIGTRAAPERPVLQLHLFGAMRLVGADGNEVAQPSPRRRATREVLAYLALHPGWVNDQKLREAVWEDDSRDSSSDLRVAITEARRWLLGGLGPAADPSGQQLIQRTGQGYRLAAERVGVDVGVFRAALDRARRDPDDVEALRAARDAYAGDLLYN
jgi:hypothetical protein